jgi:hypothetical protein
MARVLRQSSIEEQTMKKLVITTLFFAALAVVFATQPANAQVSVSISIGGFYDELEPYGRWVDCRYGECWVPARVPRHWQPYSNGEWVYTEYGWTWVSYDPWGDNPYHYGTWVWTNRWGWAWVPGTVWAPAWVTWTYNDDYVGWAPLPPSLAFGISGYSGRAIRMSPTQYVFVPTNRFVGTNVSSVRIAPERSATIFQQTTPVTRFSVSGGIVRNDAIPVERIQRAARIQIPTRSIREVKTAPRPMTETIRSGGRQVAIVAPPTVVREAISSRPQGRGRSETLRGSAGGSTGGNQGIKRNPSTGRVYQPPAAAPAAPQPAPEAYRGRPETSNQPGSRGHGRRRTDTGPQAAPPGQPPAPAVGANPNQPQPVQERGRGRGKPEKKAKGEKEKEKKEKPE